MALLKAEVPAPVLPETRVVQVPELGGEVILRPLMLSDRLALAAHARVQTPKEFAHIAALLAYCVMDGNLEPLFTVDQWEAWGSKHMTAALTLWDEAYALSGLKPEEAKKNSKAQNSSSQ